MKPGEQFEWDAATYLRHTYGTQDIAFVSEGGMDSTRSDIAVYIRGKLAFYMEAKDTVAQSGQFVLLPDDEHRVFAFSPRNRSTPNPITDQIISYMNQDYDRFRAAGTKGESVDIDPAVFADWIVGHYQNRKVAYVISHDGQGFVILPIEKYARYFTIRADFRIKQSGTGAPAQRDFPMLQEMIRALYPTARFLNSSKRMMLGMEKQVALDTFTDGKYIYQFSPVDASCYEVRRRSNTRNMNVIFGVRLRQAQDPSDLVAFQNSIR